MAKNFKKKYSSASKSELNKDLEIIAGVVYNNTVNSKVKNQYYTFAYDKDYGEVVKPGKSGNRELLNILYHAFNYIFGYSTAASFNNVMKFPLAFIAGKYDEIKEYLTDNYNIGAEPLKSFFTDIESKIEEMQHSSIERIKQKNILLEDIPLYFKNGDEIIVGSGKDAIGGIISSVNFVTSWGFAGYEIRFNHIGNATGIISDGERKAAIPAWKGKRLLESLELRKITSEEKEELTKRGKIFREVTSKPSYVSYTGTIIQPSFWSSREYRADGRIMLDPKAVQQYASELFRNLNASYGFGHYDEEDDHGRTSMVIEDADLWRTSESVFGFSFNTKQWGRMLTSGVRNIEWRNDAFDSLVMDVEKKNMIKALVEHSQGKFEDIVEGKGGGCIFLLHGVPGTGKTLTAETVAELLHRPLYMISVGELGTEPDALEGRLRQILELATTWNAVLLLDEADIFLEERDEQNIVRNAMVGVFLRLLEYHQGVLFLTTNRVKNIDKAFMSRISVALKFEGNDQTKREKIWINLLKAANVSMSNRDIKSLAAYDINGRQIKNTIRLAQTLASADGTELTLEHLTKPLMMVQEFEDDLK